jgi:hypothetical protein
VKFTAPPMLVVLTAFCALGLVIIGFLSQPVWAPMLMPPDVSFGGFAPRPLYFNTNRPPAKPGSKCVAVNTQPADKCPWYLYLGDQTRDDRIRLLLDEGGNVNEDVLEVRYGDSKTIDQRTVRAEATVIPERQRLLALCAIVFAVFGLFVLWRGRAAAVWLGLFCLCLAPTFVNFYGILSLDGMLTAWTIGMVLRLFADFALFAMALVLVAPYLHSRIASALAATGFILWIAAVVFAVLPKYEGVNRSYIDSVLDPLGHRPVAVIEIFLLGLLPLALLVYGWYKAPEPERSRLSIVAAVVAIGVVGPIIDGAAYGAGHFSGWTLAALAIPLGDSALSRD